MLPVMLLALSSAGCPISAMNLRVVARPDTPLLEMVADLEIEASAGAELACLMTPPTTLSSPYPHRFEPIADNVPVQWLKITLPSSGPAPRKLVLRYSYDAETFYGFAPNPATNDKLILGQLTHESTYSTHLYYYPTPNDEGIARATFNFDIPDGWTAVAGR